MATKTKSKELTLLQAIATGKELWHHRATGRAVLCLYGERTAKGGL